jgi:hypothetical protein
MNVKLRATVLGQVPGDFSRDIYDMKTAAGSIGTCIDLITDVPYVRDEWLETQVVRFRLEILATIDGLLREYTRLHPDYTYPFKKGI